MNSTLHSILVVSLGVFLAGASDPSRANAQELPAQELPAKENNVAIAPPAPFDLADCNGTWRPLNGKLSGRPVPRSQLESLVLDIDGGRYQTRGVGYDESGDLISGEANEGQPQPIDMVIKKGPNAGRTIEAIARLDGDKLVICFAINGYRPSSFESNDENQTLLLEYQRSAE